MCPQVWLEINHNIISHLNLPNLDQIFVNSANFLSYSKKSTREFRESPRYVNLPWNLFFWNLNSKVFRSFILWHLQFDFFLKNGPFLVSFSLFSSFHYDWQYTNIQYKFCQWLDSNRGLWYWKQLLCQLSHNHCPTTWIVFCHSVSHETGLVVVER